MTFPSLPNEPEKTSKKPFVWNPFCNTWFFLGFFWGLPIPIVVFTIGLWSKREKINYENISFFLQEYPLLWIFPSHPIIFAIIFGIFGNIRQEKNRVINHLLQQLKKEAHCDILTGLTNRRRLVEIYNIEHERMIRENRPLSIVLFDIDHFKSVNDKYGHQAGDEILKNISHLLQKNCRSYDVVSRWGGEEFLVLLPGSNTDVAHEFAERTRKNIEQYQHRINNNTINCRVSGGVTYCNSEETLEAAITRADQALYQAKNEGRNRIKTI